MLTDYAGLLDAGPPNAAAIDRPDARTLFAQGRAGFLVESSAVGPSFEDAATSKVAGKTGCAVLPPSKAGAPRLSAYADPAVTSAFDPGFVAAIREAIETSRPTAILHAGRDDGALAVVDLVLAIAGGADPEAAAARQDRALRRMMAP